MNIIDAIALCVVVGLVACLFGFIQAYKFLTTPIRFPKVNRFVGRIMEWMTKPNGPRDAEHWPGEWDGMRSAMEHWRWRTTEEIEYLSIEHLRAEVRKFPTLEPRAFGLTMYPPPKIVINESDLPSEFKPGMTGRIVYEEPKDPPND